MNGFGSKGLQDFLKSYGRIGFVTYSAVSTVSCLSWAALFSSGIDLKALTRMLEKSKIPMLEDSRFKEYAPFLALIWSAHTLIFPFRVAATFSITRLIAKRLKQ